MKYVVYALKCADGTYYIGITVNLEKRLEEHNGKKRSGAKYTMGRRPVKVIYSEEVEGRSEALKREYFLKSLSRSQKEMLFFSSNPKGFFHRK